MFHHPQDSAESFFSFFLQAAQKWYRRQVSQTSHARGRRQTQRYWIRLEMPFQTGMGCSIPTACKIQTEYVVYSSCRGLFCFKREPYKKVFAIVYGHCEVPRYYEDNPPLGMWCVTQRKRKRQKLMRADDDQTNSTTGTLDAAGILADDTPQNKKRKKPSPMTDEQETKLLMLGFEL